MRIAIMDLGTNTFHLLIGDVTNGNFSKVMKEKVPVKIGQGGISHGYITQEAKDRAVKTIKNFKKLTETHHVNHIYATATSAIRNAKNKQEVVNEIHAETGVEVRVISGLEEADYIYAGVKQAMDIGPHPALIMDIGGGSIEFIIANNEEVFWKESFEIGGQRLIDRFHQSDPISADEQSNLLKYLDESLAPLYKAVKGLKVNCLIGSSGTFDTLSDIYRVENDINKIVGATEYPLDLTELRYIINDIVSRNREERLDIPGMIPMRVDMIVVAVLLVRLVVDRLGINEIRVSAYALKEGLLFKAVDEIKESNNVLKN